MEFDEYDKLLERTSDILSMATMNQERLKIPKAIIIEDGKSSIVRNFMDMVELINRDPKDIMKYLTKAFGVGMVIDGRRLIINRKITEEEFMEKIDDYLNVYVRCYECNSPDTEILKEKRVSLIVCKACGATHPINPSRELTVYREDLEEGKTYTVTVDSLGSSGEGRAHFHEYTVIIPGVKKGQKVKVRIKKIRDKIAIAEKEDE
ncbi:translation initiation factor IF-2 subunit beta [Caldiplasma sukawensis]